MLKRAADGNWTRSERVRRALERANQAICVANELIRGATPGSLTIRRSMVLGKEPIDEFAERTPALLASLQYAARPPEPAPSPTPSTAVLDLPDDCLRIVLELALSQRTMSVYRADGTVSEPRDYYDVEWLDSCSIHTMRRVSKQWNRVASSLVRTIRTHDYWFKSMPPPGALLALFPNATAVSCNPHSSTSMAAADALVRDMKQCWNTRYGSAAVHITSIVRAQNEGNISSFMFQRRIRRRDGTFVTHRIGPVDSLSRADVFRLNVNNFINALESYAPIEPPPHKIRVYLDGLNRVNDLLMDRIGKVSKDIRMLFDIHLMLYDGDSRGVLSFVALFGKATVHMNASSRNEYFDGYCDTFYDLDAYDALAQSYIIEPLV